VRVPDLVITPVLPPLDLARTFHQIVRGTGDPTATVARDEVWRAARTPEGPATIHLVSTTGGSVAAEAWGPGAGWALANAADLAGANDSAEGFIPLDPAVEEAWRARRGVKLTRTREVTRTLVAAIFEQKVTGMQSRAAWRGLVRAKREPAPGPADLLLPPDPEVVAEMPYHEFHTFGVERRRAELVRAVCSMAPRLERLADGPPSAAMEWLERIPGIGPWTSAEVARIAFGDADAVSVGDFHMPNTVCWALAGEPRGTDERMLELLEPYRGNRARVQVLLQAAGMHAPKFGPKQPIARIERI
jgi:3-methyladenine DNA glycosylase/8-oxoguanine DNA glycosylase